MSVFVGWNKIVTAFQMVKLGSNTLTGYYVTSHYLVMKWLDLAGAAYENKEIALRVELLMQLETI